MDPSETQNDAPIQLPVRQPSPWTRILAELKKRKYLYIALAVAVAVGGGLIFMLANYKEPAPVAPSVVTKPKPKPVPKYYSPLTGVIVADEATTKRQVTAIMIENSPSARPQSGLKDAGIVYEAIAEGGITRFIALYQEARPGLIGPVRSVRPYYVEWAAGYDAAVAHIGGSAHALQMIRSGNYGVDLDQFFNSGAYWRAADRYAPHNVYTNFDKLDALTASKGKTSSIFTGFTRKEDTKAATPNAKSINVAVSTGAYTVSYAYDAASNAYVRSEGGAPHVDREGGQIMPRVVVAIRVENTTVFEDGTRQSYQVTGSGQAYIFQDGTVQEATWSKADSKAPLLLKDAAGKDIALNRGQTWITAVAPGKDIAWQ
jgi:hypothetical protein